MKKMLMFCLYFVILFGCVSFVSAQDTGEIKITILYDNYVFTEGTKSDWGFSCLIESSGKTILFDTGTNSEILMHNMNRLKVNPEKVDIIVISHNHHDHTGGLFTFLQKNSNVTVYMPASTPDGYNKNITGAGAKVALKKEPFEICKDVYLTGEMGDEIKEQSLVINTDKGLIVLTGCAHPGITGIVKKAGQMVEGNLHFVFGGFHLFRTPDSEVEQIVKEFKKMGVEKTGATHCTGDKAIDVFKKVYKDDYLSLGTGKVLTF